MKDARITFGLIGVGLLLILLTTFMDALTPCAWFDLGCKGTRFLLFVLTALLGIALIGVAIWGAAKTESAGRAAFGASRRYGGKALHYARRRR